ncbi:MAG: hypothetical protein OXG35_28505, partial [Acidobacteria bacterium]|nr:hypothetical protein [Acidobacteriota bacterium]
AAGLAAAASAKTTVGDMGIAFRQGPGGATPVAVLGAACSAAGMADVLAAAASAKTTVGDMGIAFRQGPGGATAGAALRSGLSAGAAARETCRRRSRALEYPVGRSAGSRSRFARRSADGAIRAFLL